MPSLSDILTRPQLKALIQNPTNESGVKSLLDYIQQLKENFSQKALSRDGGDFEKGQHDAVKSLHTDIMNIMSDTETETGK